MVIPFVVIVVLIVILVIIVCRRRHGVTNKVRLQLRAGGSMERYGRGWRPSPA